ncbi:MAG: hypothetical protein WEB62_10255, partial [Bacteroidota bacterium]
MNKKTRSIFLLIIGLIILFLIASPKLSLFSTATVPSSTGARADMRLPVSVHILVPERVEDKIRS